MQRAETAFIAINRWVLIIILAAMSIIVFSNVVSRYLTNYSIIWADEVARYLMIWLTFLGAGLTLRYGGHVAITNLMDVLPTPAQRVLRAIIAACLLAFFVLMIWIGYSLAMRVHLQLTPATRIPFSYIYAAIPVGFALLVVHLLLVVREYVLENRFRDAAGVPGDMSSSVGG